MNRPKDIGYAKSRELAQARSAIERATVQPAASGSTVSAWPTGTLVTARRVAGGRRVGSPRNPFALSGFIDGATAKIRVYPGMVGNTVPTIGGTSLAAVPAPAITVTGSSGQIWIGVTVDGGGNVTDAVITNETAEPEDTATVKYRLIGSWTASGGLFTSVTSILNANQTLYLCNGTAIWEGA